VKETRSELETSSVSRKVVGATTSKGSDSVYFFPARCLVGTYSPDPQ